MGMLNKSQQWIMEVPVGSMTPNQKLDALRILDMVIPLRMYTDKVREIRDSMSIPKQKRKKGKQEKLFEVKVKSGNLPGSR